jgi:hypothetical protein
MISAATAATLTTALGEAYVATLAHLFNESGGEQPSTETIADEFKRRIKGRRGSGEPAANQGDSLPE